MKTINKLKVQEHARDRRQGLVSNSFNNPTTQKIYDICIVIRYKVY